jgi:hypothetical protein
MTDIDHLATVRQAYRYVVAYERRVLDAITVVHEAVETLGFEFGGWASRLTTFPKKTRFTGHDWAWDNHPLYNAQLRWALGGRLGNAAGNVWLFVEHVADTGFEAAYQTSRAELNPLADLQSVSECDSLLRARWLRFDAPVNERLWHKSWEQLLEAHFNKKITELWPVAPVAAPSMTAHDGVRTGGLVISIGSIGGPEAFRSGFVEPVVGVLGELMLGAAARAGPVLARVNG